MSQRIKVATLDTIPPGNATTCDVQGTCVALFNVEGTIHAIDDECPHAGASLSAGGVKDGKIGCPWHTAEFDLKTGAVLCPPARGDVRVYKVHVEGTDIFLEL